VAGVRGPSTEVVPLPPGTNARTIKPMRRMLVRIFQGLVVLLAVSYLADLAFFHVRAQSQATSTVQVEQFLRTPLKGTKEEFDYQGTVAEPCVRSLYPHNDMTPCWWLTHHKIQWVSP
jgi:hypothetical protein